MKAKPLKIPLTESTAYPICNINFAFGSDTLGPSEITLLAMLSYREHALINKTLTYFLGGESFILANKYLGANFFHIKATSGTPSSYGGFEGNVIKHFIAIRGTKSPEDALQDMSLWSEISSFQIINFFIPLL